MAGFLEGDGRSELLLGRGFGRLLEIISLEVALIAGGAGLFNTAVLLTLPSHKSPFRLAMTTVPPSHHGLQLLVAAFLGGKGSFLLPWLAFGYASEQHSLLIRPKPEVDGLQTVSFA